MNFLITPAYAQAAGTPGGADFVMQMAPFAIILVIMYFLILRPQQKRAKAHSEMIANVRRGDTIVTTGGIVAKVTKVTDDPEIEVELAPNVRVRLIRTMITDVRTKGEPVKD
ncbi:MAG: yajC [Hyphomicrobiales bacterium]|jgi:preprotein translocase subunit YajC|nr:yajC [Hyphomicrobiales bacterium]